jgi:hypothetical protein
MCNPKLVVQIKRACQKGNTPGLNDQIFLTFMEEITSIPAANTNSMMIGGNIGFRPAAVATTATATEPAHAAIPLGAFVPIDVRRKGATYKSGQKGEGENVYFEPEWDYIIDRLDEIVSFGLESMKGAKLAIVAADKNGKMKFCPNVFVTYEEGVTDSENGYKLKIMGDKMPHAPMFYNGLLPLRDLDPN